MFRTHSPRRQPQRQGLSRQRRWARPLVEALEDRLVPTDWFVSTLGADINPGTIAAPFATIQHAVNVAQGGDRIHVALGVYGYTGADRLGDDARFGSPGLSGTLSGDFLHVNPAVVLIYNKSLQIYGGFNNDFTSWAPATFRTYIDGGGVNRGVYVLGNGFNGMPPSAFATPAGLDMEGFTIQACKATGEPGLSGFDAINAYGAGMWINTLSTTPDFQGPFVLKNMVFRGNLAVGNNTLRGSGGSAAGAALELGFVQNLSLDHVTFDTNRIQSGTGGPASGDARGAALDVNASSRISGNVVTFYNNMAVAAANGTALGAGMEVRDACSATLQNVIALNNSVSTNAGTGMGGAFAAEDGTINLTNADIRGNVVTDSGSGGQQGGGGIASLNSQLTLNQVQVINNTVTSAGATASGGGLYVGFSNQVPVSGSNPGSVTMTNAVVADNTVQVTNQPSPPTVTQGGGGMLLQGVVGNIITQCTFANNHLSGNLLDGQAILLTNGGPHAAVAIIADSIIANHTNTNGAAALSVLSQSPNNMVTLSHVLYADNSKDDNSDGQPNAAGTFNGLNTVIRAASAGFTSPGAPNYDYSISASSPAVGQAVGSTARTDIEGNPFTTADLGAYAAPAPPRARSSVALFDPETGIWQLRQSNAGGFFPDGPVFAYGSGGGHSKPLVGDWNGDGTATVGVVEVKALDFNGKPFLTDASGNAVPVSVFELRNSNGPGTPDIVVPYGSFSATPVAGNWDNNPQHFDHIGVVEIQNGVAVWKLRNSFTRGGPDITLSYGGVTSTPVVSDWNGDGVTTLGVVENNGGVLQWKLRNSFTPGPPDAGSFAYGLAVSGGANVVPITGDWNNDKAFTPGIYDSTSGLWQLRNENSGGPPDAGAFTFGPSVGSNFYAERLIPLAGDFDGLA
jgi:hypothetical protein